MTTQPIQSWLVVTDLDGTLWSSRRQVHPATLEALDELSRRGVAVLAATGRRPASARDVLADHGLSLPVVAFDGSLGRDHARGEDFHAAPFPAATAQRILAAFRALDLEPVVNVATPDDADARLGQLPSTDPRHVAYIEQWARRADLDEVVSREPVLLFGLMGLPREPLDELAALVADDAEATVLTDVQYGGWGISVRVRGSDKWAGVLAYCARHDVDPARVLAIGDGNNDRELLVGAAVAVAIAGSEADALGVADHRIPPPETGGWARVIDLLDAGS